MFNNLDTEDIAIIAGAIVLIIAGLCFTAYKTEQLKYIHPLSCNQAQNAE